MAAEDILKESLMEIVGGHSISINSEMRTFDESSKSIQPNITGEKLRTVSKKKIKDIENLTQKNQAGKKLHRQTNKVKSGKDIESDDSGSYPFLKREYGQMDLIRKKN